MTLCVNKASLRISLKSSRHTISPQRREEAVEQLAKILLPKIASYQSILSFHSLPQEIDTAPLNALLSAEKKLFLPRVEGNRLLIYQVSNLDSELVQSPFHIWEPNPNLCTPCALENIDCILVPGLGFDSNNHRIGYGKGHYDRLLAKVNESSFKPMLIGLGFKEQYVEVIPSEPHDIPLTELVLL